MKTLLVAVLALLVVPAAPAADLRPITHEDVWLAKRVSAPKASPDGRWVVFTVAEPAYDDAGKSADLWIMPADGSAPAKRLTSNRGGESDVAWSEDSRRIVFAAKREGDAQPQIYALDLALGGEAWRLTHAPHGARSPVLSPDGRRLAYVSDLPADPAAAEHKYKVRAFDGFPIRNWDHWLDGSRPHLFVQSLDHAGAPEGEPSTCSPGRHSRRRPGTPAAGRMATTNSTPSGRATAVTSCSWRARIATRLRSRSRARIFSVWPRAAASLLD